MSDYKTRLIAFYLPQFYPTPENDEWWRKGFTEWTNVGNAKPLFKGHYQPRVPADLGYYDLRVPEVREQQAELAREGGIEGFCYWHYWFAGRRLLDKVFTEVVESGKPDFPFCLCWANHSWYQKTWDPSSPDKLLIEQTYPGEEDYKNQFYAMLPAFKDKRYMKTDGKLIYGIFDPVNFADFHVMKDIWNRLASENGLPGFYFFGFCQGEHRLSKTQEAGYDAIVYEHMTTVSLEVGATLLSKIKGRIKRPPLAFDYSRYVKEAVKYFKQHPELTPCIMPNFDHSPRSGWKGTMMINSTPQKWYDYCRQIKELEDSKGNKESLVFIKAWNEWGEGNYMEPDLRYGKEYLEETRKGFE
jgi:hypothetical protein